MAGPSDQKSAEDKKLELLEFWRPTESWVRVHLRRFGKQNVRWRVQRRGDPLKGTVSFKVEEAEAAWSIFTQVRTAGGSVHWMRAHGTGPMSRQQADTYLQAATARDPDLWIIETEPAVMSQNGWRLFDP
jgi:hypothetical protein